MALICSEIPDLHLAAFGSATQCFPLYTYTTDGKERRDNIPRTALDKFALHYDDEKITRADIFHYVYAVLHHPEYRARYAENLKRELPRIPFAPDFHALAKAGRKLAELHVGYEEVKPWKLRRVEHKDTPLDWRVEAMKLTKEGDAVIYNDHFTFAGVPSEAHEYRLGNRSALDWVIDQYRVTRDSQGDIISDPNRNDDEEYIANLVARVVTVSVETVSLMKSLADLAIV
jgi:predicted helicase